jgi:hypothetical protein
MKPAARMTRLKERDTRTIGTVLKKLELSVRAQYSDTLNLNEDD